MPAKHSIKQYQQGGYYHLFNRGAHKQDIFLDQQDYSVFLSYLKLYLTPPNLQGSTLQVPPSKQLKNYADEITLLSYCLMPNHFHFLVKQNTPNSITQFIRSLSTKYSMYFNKKHRQSGSLFQGIYKAVQVVSEPQLIHLTKYIHLNPTDTNQSPTDYSYSSLPNYLGQIRQDWLKPQEILDYFSQSNPNFTYRSFILEQPIDQTLINHLTIDLQGWTL